MNRFFFAHVEALGRPEFLFDKIAWTHSGPHVGYEDLFRSKMCSFRFRPFDSVLKFDECRHESDSLS